MRIVHSFIPGVFLAVLIIYLVAGTAIAQNMSETPVDSNHTQKKYPVKIIYISNINHSCELRLFELSTQKIKVLAKPDFCPQQVSLSRDQTSVILLTSESLQQIHISPMVVVGKVIPLPVPKVKEGNTAGTPAYAGTTDNGTLALVMESVYPYDDSDEFLYVYKRSMWTRINEHVCRRYDECIFEELRYRDQDYYTWRELDITHENQKKNPYVIEKIVKREGEGANEQLVFNINGKNSYLYFNTRPSEHTDASHTESVSLKTEGKDTLSLTKRQCNATVVGKHLYLRRYWSAGNELIDIENGESVLGFIEHARWLYQ